MILILNGMNSSVRWRRQTEMDGKIFIPKPGKYTRTETAAAIFAEGQMMIMQ